MSRIYSAELMSARQEFLEALYFADGRDSADHPHHAHYTGLFQAWVKHCKLHQIYEKLQHHEQLDR